jgi:HEAT repeat protein
MYKKRIAVCFLVSACSLVCWGQRVQDDPNQTDAQRYQEAYDYVLEENWDKALTAFETFIRQYEESPYLDDVHFWHCFAMEKTGAADEDVFTCYQDLIKSYPKSQWADDAERNLIIVGKRLADMGKTEYGAFIKAMQESADKEIALTAISALRNIGNERALDALAGLYSSSQQRAVREEIIFAISQFKSPKVVSSLTKIVKEDPDRHMRERALFWLGQKTQSKEAIQLMEHVALNDPNHEVRDKAVFALAQVREGKSVETLKRIARTAKDTSIRKSAVFWMGQKARSADVIEFLEKVAVEDPITDIRKTALHALSQAPEGGGVEALKKVGSTAKDADTRKEAILWLGQRAKSKDVIEFLETVVLKDTDAEVREMALHSLSQAPGNSGFEALKKIAETSTNVETRKKAVFWLGQRAKSEEVIAFLETVVLNDTDGEIRRTALLALSQAREGRGVKALMKIGRTSKNIDTRRDAIFWIGQQAKSDDVIQFLESVVREDADPEVRKRAVAALVHAPQNLGVPALINLAKSHPDYTIRREAIFWLGQSKDPRAMEALVDIVNDMNE